MLWLVQAFLAIGLAEAQSVSRTTTPLSTLPYHSTASISMKNSYRSCANAFRLCALRVITIPISTSNQSPISALVYELR